MRGVGIAALGGLFFAGNLAFWASGVLLSGATNPTLLLNTAPLWVGLGAVILWEDDASGEDPDGRSFEVEVPVQLS